jgi:hypothetical protein
MQRLPAFRQKAADAEGAKGGRYKGGLDNLEFL